jgi:thioredoxin 1
VSLVQSSYSETTPQALDALLQANKRALVDYHTTWCAPCRKMRPFVDAVAEAWKGQAMVLRVDIGESEALPAREKIQGVPVFVVYVDGKERWRGSGEMSREALEAELARP